jgi:transcriptional regulator GlxA family with amidase domain
MRSNVPTPAAPVRIAVLLSPQSSVALAFLLRAVFERANRLLGTRRYAVQFVRSAGAGAIELQDALVPARAPRGRYDYLVVTPLDDIAADYVPSAADVALARRQHARGAVVASACLGALTLASAGLLDGRAATTHWAWRAFVTGRHPGVDWALDRMVCDLGDVVTAGGYLATVDLALHIVGKTSTREVAHRIGRTLLADSARQRQSLYAQALIDPRIEHGALRDLAAWVERRLAEPLTARDMARHSRMSLRSFHRKFREAFRVTPRKYLQIKRIERSQALLRNTSRSVEQVLQAVGVSDVTSFRRVFQRELGCTPSEYRRRLRR